MLAFFAAPLVAPLLAIVLAAALPGVYSDGFATVVALPVIVVVALVYGYAGMVLVCLPVYLLLKRLGKLTPARLCFFTTLLGGVAWTWLQSASLIAWSPVGVLLIGLLASLGVVGFFCLLGGVPRAK